MIKKLPPQIPVNIVESMIFPPMVDALNMRLTCTALVNKNNYSLVGITWTGVGIKSIWVTLSRIIEEKDCIKRDLLFRPWLHVHIGKYTCHLIIKDQDNSTFMLHRTVTVNGMYVSIIILLSTCMYSTAHM